MRALANKLALMITDALLTNAAVIIALLIRFEGNPPQRYVYEYEKVALVYTVLTIAIFALIGMYSNLWRYASVGDASTVLWGALGSAFLLFVLVYGVPRVGLRLGWQGLPLVKSFPRSVVILTFLLITALTGGLRFSLRYAHRSAWARGPRSRFRGRGSSSSNGRQTRVLVVGAGDAGALVARELAKHTELGYEALGFVDDDSAKQGLRVHGLAVLGRLSDLPRLVQDLAANEVIVAMPSVGGAIVRQIVDSVGKQDVTVKTLPGMYELLGGSVSISQIREVQIEDLLGREPVAVDLEEIAGYLRGQCVLVTGAGGSIGSELCRQVAAFHPRELVLLDNSENGVFETSLGLGRHFPTLRAPVVIADIRDRPKIRRIFDQYRPSVVFHAAAHKHVPLMESHPDEAVKTNILGTRNVAEAAIRAGAKRFVLISTDKAVNPSSVMGATKRVAEMIVQTLDAGCRRDGGSTRLVAVRFGNVLGSRGSVVPTFKEQIALGGPVTVTHPDMRRYFMTIPEAVQLVIQAGAMGQGGEIFILDMGEPVRILDLAENLIRLSGFEPGSDIPVVITGPRPGEKLFEELLTAEEGTVATRHKRIFVGRIHAVNESWLTANLGQLAAAVSEDAQDTGIVAKLQEMIPNYQPISWEQVAATVEN